MAYKRSFYRAKFVSGMEKADKNEFLEDKFNSACSAGLGGVIVGRPSDGPVFVLEGEEPAVQAMVDDLDSSPELTDRGEACREDIASHEEPLALFLEDSVDDVCNF